MKRLTLAGLLLLAAMATRADEITLIESELSVDSLSPTINLELATNIWTAHEDTPYALTEADSLELSIEAVLCAVSVAGLDVAFIQSNIAIDDRASVDITVNGQPCNNDCTVDFGDVAVPEPSPAVLLLSGLVIVLGWLRFVKWRVK